MAQLFFFFLKFAVVRCGQAMLHFIYRDTLVEDEELLASSSSCESSVSDTLAAKLLAAADTYGLGRLRLMCESYLCKDITVSSVARLLALADRHHAMELKAVCLKFSAENLAGMPFRLILLFLLLTSSLNFPRALYMYW